MRIAVISDIHGNLEAFQQVLADIDLSDVDDVICLGDNIGYGPDPEPVVELIRNRHIPCVLGNHELAVGNKKILDWFNPAARTSLEHTIARLSDMSIDFMKDLPPCLVRHGCRFVHGFPPESAIRYLFEISKDKLYRTFAEMAERICFVGHTHELVMASCDGDRLTSEPLGQGFVQLDKSSRYIINIGSVGQPRDGDNRSKYVIYETTSETIDVRFVPYDISAVAGKIIAAGLPEVHALRLR